jgi:hypothetical protein
MLNLILNHFHQHYDSHLAALSTTVLGLALPTRLENLAWAVLTGTAVFLMTQLLKKVLKLK